MGKRYRRMKDQKLGPELTCNQNFAKGGGLELKLRNNFFKNVFIGRVEVSKLG